MSGTPKCQQLTEKIKTLSSKLTFFVVLFALFIILLPNKKSKNLVNGAPCPLTASTTSLSSPPAATDLFWSSRDQFLAAHVGSDLSNSDSESSTNKCPEKSFSVSSSDQLKATDNFQFVRIPNEHQWEAGNSIFIYWFWFLKHSYLFVLLVVMD